MSVGALLRRLEGAYKSNVPLAEIVSALVAEGITLPDGRTPTRGAVDHWMRYTAKKLTREDYAKVGIPENLRRCTSAGVTPKYGFKKKIIELCLKMPVIARAGAGLLLYGAGGTGKTGAAVVLAMQARQHAFSAYFTSPTQVREFITEKMTFDDQPILQRLREIDVLVLDALRAEDLTGKLWTFGSAEIADLYNQRVARGKLTIFTTRMNEGDIGLAQKDLLLNAMTRIWVQGDDRRDAPLDFVIGKPPKAEPAKAPEPKAIAGALRLPRPRST